VSEIKRIVPEEVVEIFEKLNLKPTKGKYFNESVNCACAVGAIYLNEKPESIDNSEAFSTVASLGYKDNYLAGVIYGFDDDPNVNIGDSSEYDLGFEDGVKVREMLIEKGHKILYLGREQS
jgi:hypothetical protein